ncbi:MAG: phosphopantetheine-binding protein [Puniceicoccales bacterium]
MSDELRQHLKELTIETLNLEDYSPSDLSDDEPLFGAGLDLDSIDALELVLELEKEYGIKIQSSEESRKALKSIATLAAYIEEHRKR